MKQQLLILSDLWGIQKASYLPLYTTLLQPKYDIQFLDCCQLGKINTSNYTQENLHQQFVNGGIEKAVKNLLKNYPQEVDILAFSIGGTIAWKANLASLKVRNLYAISATRLRYETEKPNSQIRLFYGGIDAYQPAKKWFDDLAITDYHIFEQEGHDIYQKSNIIQQICNQC
ncbi:MAG: alpha/beta hydrolase [Saprospiraceae bacterium]